MEISKTYSQLNSFNSTLVQLKGKQNMKYQYQKSRFNSTLVQLKANMGTRATAR